MNARCCEICVASERDVDPQDSFRPEQNCFGRKAHLADPKMLWNLHKRCFLTPLANHALRIRMCRVRLLKRWLLPWARPRILPPALSSPFIHTQRSPAFCKAGLPVVLNVHRINVDAESLRLFRIVRSVVC